MWVAVVAIALAGGAPTSLHVSVNGTVALHTIPATFSSIAIDSDQLNAPSTFWHDNGTFPWASGKLIRMAAALAPAYLRVGGSAGDKLYYNVSGTGSGAPRVGCR